MGLMLSEIVELRGLAWLVSTTLEDRQPRIFGKRGVGQRLLAEIEIRSAIGLNQPHMLAGGAQPDVRIPRFWWPRFHVGTSIFSEFRDG